jgi:hypothetical protein
MRALLGPGIGLGPVTLFLHEATEPVLVNPDALFGSHLERQLDGEAIGVMQRKRLVTCKRGLTGRLGPGHRGVQERRAGREGAVESLLLGISNLRDA